MKAWYKLFFALVFFPALAHTAGDYDGSYYTSRGRMVGLEQKKPKLFLVKYADEQGLVYSLDLSKRINSFPVEAIDAIKKRSGLAKAVLKGINIVNAKKVGNKLTAEIEYQVAYASGAGFGSFEAEFVGDVVVELKEKVIDIEYRKDFRLSLFNLKALGKDIKDRSTLTMAKMILGLVLDIGARVSQVGKTSLWLYN